MPRFIVTGTDTSIGKTVFSAGLTGALSARYWKPVQAGLDAETDSQCVARLSGCVTLREAYRLRLPASPHLAAEAEGVTIDCAGLHVPDINPLVIEGAGGVMVPLTRSTLFVDVFARWKLPVILCARTALGTINHSLLSLMALRQRGCTVLGVAFIGAANPPVEETICSIGTCRHLGRLPHLADLTPDSLRTAFAAGFDLAAFAAP